MSEPEEEHQAKGDAVIVKPDPTVGKTADGTLVVELPGVKEVKVVDVKPVELQADVELSDKKLKENLEHQNDVNKEEQEKASEVEKAVKAADLATTEDMGEDNGKNHDFQSHVTLYHWKMFDQATQLKMYKESVYRGNKLEDIAVKAKVAIKLTEE